MKTKGLSFPHPVLRPSDDYESPKDKDISAEYSVKRSDTKITDTGLFETTLAHELSPNSSIEQLILSGSALFCTEIQCKKTFFRTAFETKENTQTISIPVNKIHGQIELQVFVVAAKNIKEYSPFDAHKDYEGASFFIHKGDVLAYGLSEKVFIERSGNGISSMIKVDEDKKRKSGPCSVILGDNQIWVNLPADDFKRFQQISASQFVGFVHREISLIALFEAVKVILQWRTKEVDGHTTSDDDGNQDYSELKWFVSLADIIDTKYPDTRIDADDAYKLAQELLENPLLISIKQIEEYDNSL
jgi:hypothetical protein